MNKMLVIAAVPLMLVACGSPEPEVSAPVEAPAPVGQPAPVAEPVPGTGWDTSSPEAADVSLAILPDPVDFCTTGTQSVTVSWEIARSYASPQVWVQVGTTPKLFAAPSNRTSSAETGNWVREGTTFYLVDAATNRVLKQAQPTAKTCD